MSEKPVVHLPDLASAERWFAAHADDQVGAFLKIAKKGGSVPTPSYAELVDLALCHGWIDGQNLSVDADCYALSFTPRRARSPWSRVNREKAERLIAEGRMLPAGLAEVERARANGRWDAAYEGSSTAEVPQDFLDALESRPGAKATYGMLTRAQLFQIYYQLNDAKRPETRQRRAERFLDLLERGEKPG